MLEYRYSTVELNFGDPQVLVSYLFICLISLTLQCLKAEPWSEKTMNKTIRFTDVKITLLNIKLNLLMYE